MKLKGESVLISPSISIENVFDVVFWLSTTDNFSTPSLPVIDNSSWPRVDAARFSLLRVSFVKTKETSASGILISFVGTVKDEIYRFTKKTGYQVKTGGYLTDAKKNFAKYVAHGMDPVKAYQKAFPKTISLDHAERRSTLLLKNKTVRQAVDKEIENLMSEVGITKRYLLETTKDVIDKIDVRDNDKLRAIETLMKISCLLSTEKKVDSVALIQEFSGFSREKLQAFEQGILPEKQKELTDG